MNRQKTPLLLILFGIVVVLVYLATTTGLITGVNNLLLALVFAIGPVAIVGVLNISGTKLMHRLCKPERYSC